MIKNSADHNTITKFPNCEKYFFQSKNDGYVKSTNHKKTMSINFPQIQSMMRKKNGKRKNQDKHENDGHLNDEKNKNCGKRERKSCNKNSISNFLEENSYTTQKNITENSNHINGKYFKENDEIVDFSVSHSKKSDTLLLDRVQKNGLNKINKTNKINEMLQIKPNVNIANQPLPGNPDSERFNLEESTFFNHIKHEKHFENIKKISNSNIQISEHAKKLDYTSIQKNADTPATLDLNKTLIHLNPNLSNETLSSNMLDLDPSRRKLGDALKKLHSFRKRVLPIGKNKTETKDFFLINDFENKIDDFKKIQDEKYGIFNYSLEGSTLPEDQIDRTSILGILNPSKYKEIGVVTERLVASKFNKKFYLKR